MNQASEGAGLKPFANPDSDSDSISVWDNGSRIGILGGGQLARMMALAGILLLIGWTIYLRATARSLGAFGLILAAAFFGTLLIGAQAVPVSPIYTSHEIEYMANDSGAETIICLDTNYCYVKEILKKSPMKRVIVTNLVDMLPAWKRVAGFLFDKVPGGSYDKKAPEVFKFNKIWKRKTRSLLPWKNSPYKTKSY